MSTVPSVASSASSVSENSAIFWTDSIPKRPCWDVSRITAFPVTLGQRSVYAFLTPYAPDELKAVLAKAVSGYKRDRKDTEIVREDRNIYASLFDAHFVKLGNATGTPDEQRAYIDRNAYLKSGLIEFSFGGLQMDQTANQPDDDDVLDIATELSGTTKVFQEIYDTETDQVVRVDITHRYGQPSETQFRRYKNARRNRFVHRTAIWTITENHGALEQLYDELIQSVDGLLVNGNPCVKETKAEWVAGIPLWHKIWIVDQIFGTLLEKNA